MKQGDVVLIIENNKTVRECKIVRINWNLAIIRFQAEYNKENKRKWNGQML